MPHWIKDVRGAVAPVFALTIVLTGGLAGLAVDYGRAVVARSSMQSALDSAVLAAATQEDHSPDALVAKAHALFQNNWMRHRYVETPTVSIVDDGSGKLTGTASLSLETTLLHLLHQDALEVRVTSEVQYGVGKAEVALVLDNTGSMDGQKLADLKFAATKLIEGIYAHPYALNKVKFALVPFSQYVNVGLAFRNETWMSVPLDYSESYPNCGMVTPLIGTTNCRMVTATYYNDGVPYQSTYEQCDSVYGPEEYQCNPYTVTYTWNGCVGSRNYPLNTRDDSYGTPIPGLLNAWCTAPITRLTNDTTDLTSKIDAMTATGNTYIPAGLIWGWRLLSPQAPFSDGEDPANPTNGVRPRKIIVLMTDGENTLSPDYPGHDGGDTALANNLTKEICSNIKADNIEIFTVAFDVTNATIKSVLNACASGPPYYFDATSSADLVSSFDNVARSLTQVRLAK